MSASLYSRLVAMGAEVDSHESDLHVKATPEVCEMLFAERRATGLGFTRFCPEGTHESWFDVPFMYAPYWEARAENPPRYGVRVPRDSEIGR